MISAIVIAASLAVSASPDIASVDGQPAINDAIHTLPEQTMPRRAVVCEPTKAGGTCALPDVSPPQPAVESRATGDQREIVVTAQKDGRPADPLRSVNEASFKAVNAVDDAVLRPVALTYKKIAPQPVRDGIRNFLNNLHEPVVALNFLIQIKPGKAAETIGRFGVNSTIGLAGFFDMARRHPINLPRRPNGFADSLGFYGVKPGPYLFLPIIGPTTLRDLAGGTLDGFVLPLGVGRPFNKVAYTLPTGILRGLDRRIAFDDTLSTMKTNGDDFYAVRRAFYLKQRQAEIDALHGKVAQ